MAENTKIEWAHHTFNPWEGCQNVGPGCDNCYAETRNARFAGGTAVNWGPGAPRRRTSAANWNKPLRWNAEAERLGIRYRVFCASLADVFDNAVPDSWRMDLFKLIADTPHLDWLLLTKRIGNVMAMCSRDGLMFDMIGDRVWLGATIVNQAEADRDIPKLLAAPARVRFLSMEPLLGPVDVRRYMWPVHGWWKGPYNSYQEAKSAGAETGLKRQAIVSAHARFIDWVIVGGESGSGARPMHPDWARSLRDQCAAAGTPFLFKQWGEWVPRGPKSMGYPIVDGVPRVRLTDLGENGSYLGAEGDNHVWMQRAGKKVAGRLLYGVQHDGFPNSNKERT